MLPRPKPEPTAPGQESVWDYPRPAIAEPTSLRLQVKLDGRFIADTTRGVRALETSHPPSYYFHPDDVDMEALRKNTHASMCEWKGQATYFDVLAKEGPLVSAAWAYNNPTPSFEILKGFITFYAHRMEACFVDGERVTPQPGNFYGGWITSHVAGPFKGVPGSNGW